LYPNVVTLEFFFFYIRGFDSGSKIGPAKSGGLKMKRRKAKSKHIVHQYAILPTKTIFRLKLVKKTSACTSIQIHTHCTYVCIATQWPQMN